MIANCTHCFCMQYIDGSTVCVNRECAHRADLAVAECDCERCRPRSVEQCIVTDEALTMDHPDMMTEKDDDDTDLFAE